MELVPARGEHSFLVKWAQGPGPETIFLTRIRERGRPELGSSVPWGASLGALLAGGLRTRIRRRGAGGLRFGMHRDHGRWSRMSLARPETVQWIGRSEAGKFGDLFPFSTSSHLSIFLKGSVLSSTGLPRCSFCLLHRDTCRFWVGQPPIPRKEGSWRGGP